MALYRVNGNYGNTPDIKVDEICLDFMAEYVQAKELKHVNTALYNEKKQNASNCLRKFGDIYKQLDIELYVLPNKKVIFPDSSRINAHFNIFLRNYQVNPKTAKIVREQEKKLKLFDFILHDIYREVYNEFYYLNGFSTSDSLTEKSYGMERLLDKVDDAERDRHDKEKSNNKKKFSSTLKYIKSRGERESQLERERESRRQSITKKRSISIKMDDPLNNVVTFDKPIPIQELEAVAKPNASNILEYKKSSKSDKKTSKNTQLPLLMAEPKNIGGSRKINKRYKIYKRYKRY